MSYTPPSDSEAGDFIRCEVAAGFHSPDSISEHAVRLFDIDRAAADAMVEAARAGLAQDQARWPATTDCDRLDAAFSALDRGGLLARHHVGCCSTCGHSEMSELLYRERVSGRALDGYVFYNQQDTDEAVLSGPLRLRVLAAAEDGAAIGRRVVEALRAEGLEVAWDGDPGARIELPSFRWQRRRAPPPPGAGFPASLAIERWCDAIVEASPSALANALGEGYGLAALEAGRADVAIAWSRATRSALSLGSIARALGEAGAAEAPRAALLVEAYAAAPFGAGEVVDLLVRGSLDDPAVHAAARARVDQRRRDLNGAAELGWYVVRAPAELLDDAAHDHLMHAARHTFENPREPVDILAVSEKGPYDSFRVAAAAALWVLHDRVGEGEQAEAAREIALEPIEAGDLAELSGFAQRAVIHAAAEVGELADLSDAISAQVPALASEVTLALARDLPGSAGADAPAADLGPELARAEARDAELDDEYAEGLLRAEEVREARVALARLRARSGDLARARSGLAALAARERDAVLAETAALRAHLEQVRAGARGPALPVDASWFTPAGEAALARHLAAWEAKPTAHRGRKLVEAAGALAQRGEAERARALLARVLPDGDMDVVVLGVGPTAVRAWCYLDELDHAIDYVEALGYFRHYCAAPLVVRLAELGRRSDALALLGRALDRPHALSGLTALAPAVLAVADDPRACAAAMLEALQRADAALEPLIPEVP